MIDKGREDPRDDGDSLDPKELREEIDGTRDHKQRELESKG
jgi:hypothetical protein